MFRSKQLDWLPEIHARWTLFYHPLYFDLGIGCSQVELSCIVSKSTERLMVSAMVNGDGL